MPRLALGRLLCCCLVLAAAPAAAQPAGNIELDAFHPAMDSRGYLTVNASQTLGDREVSFGLGSLDWGHHLLEFHSGTATYSVDDAITATLIAAVGLKLGPADLEFGASLPFSIMSGDRGPDFVASDPTMSKQYKFDGQGIGNLGLHFKTRFIKTSRPPHVGLGLVASLYLPTTDPTNRFLGEAMAQPSGNAKGALVPQLMGVVDKEFGRESRFRMALNAGIRLRSTQTFTNSDPGVDGAPVTNGTITASAEIPFGLGMAYAIKPQKFDVVGEVFGAIPLGSHTDYQPLDVILKRTKE